MQAAETGDGASPRKIQKVSETKKIEIKKDVPAKRATRAKK